jgi:hypothetical protein
VNRHTFGAWFDYGPNPSSATINEHGTVTDLVDTGSDLSYFSAADEFIHQNGSAGINLKWDSDNVSVEFDGHHSFANSDGGIVGTNNFGIVGQWPGIALTKTFSMGGGTIPTTTWTYAPPHNLSNLGTDTIDPLFGQANNNVFYTVIDEARLDATWKNTSQSGLKSIKVGFDFKRMTTRAESFNSGNFAWGYYNPAYNGMIPASAFTQVSTCSILKSFSGGGCGIAVPYFYSFTPVRLPRRRAAVPPETRSSRHTRLPRPLRLPMMTTSVRRPRRPSCSSTSIRTLTGCRSRRWPACGMKRAM